MAFGRKAKCQRCGVRGRCTCQLRVNWANDPENPQGNKVCEQMCKGPNKPACGKVMPGGKVCPCPDCF